MQKKHIDPTAQSFFHVKIEKTFTLALGTQHNQVMAARGSLPGNGLLNQSCKEFIDKRDKQRRLVFKMQVKGPLRYARIRDDVRDAGCRISVLSEKPGRGSFQFSGDVIGLLNTSV
jgi:hypothetical protein